ncbi:hypothetical protein ABKV19_005116 [Rosa sericea]
MATALLSEITALIPTKLDFSRPYQVWRYAMTAVLESRNLMGYVDSTTDLKGHSSDSDNVRMWCSDGELSDWEEAEDRAVMAVINATLAPSVLARLIRCVSARSLWLELEEIFTKMEPFHVKCLYNKLSNLVFKRGQTVEGFVGEVESIWFDMVSRDAAIPEAEMVDFVLSRFPFPISNGEEFQRPRSLRQLYTLLLQETIVQDGRTKAETEAVLFSHYI